MEHMCFELQLCIKISIFKEKHVFDILIILCLGTTQYLYVYFESPGNDCTKDEKKNAEEVGRLRRPTCCVVLGS